jgi:hypothetical protein
MDAASLRIRNINGASGIHRNSRCVAHTRVFKGLQWSAARFKFVDKTGAGVGKENVPKRICRECHGGVKLAGALAFISPGAEELERRRRLRFRRRICAVSAGNEEKNAGKGGLRKYPSHWTGICLRHAANVSSEIARTFRIGYYHALLDVAGCSTGKCSKNIDPGLNGVREVNE